MSGGVGKKMGHFGKALLGKLGVNLGRSQIIREALGKIFGKSGKIFGKLGKLKKSFEII